MQPNERFALSPSIDLDIDVTGAGLVGLSYAADPELTENIFAALIARALGNKSVDYTRKRYGKHVDQFVDHDAPVKNICHVHLSAYNRFYRSIVPREGAPLGVFAFDLTMVRSQTSLELMLYAARRGYLIEVSLIARGVLEQLAYAHGVWGLDSDEEIFEVRPNRMVPGLKSVRKDAGRLYGWLSKLSHYDPKEHYQFIGDREGATVTQRSWKFKIIGFAILFAILDLKLSVFRRAYNSFPEFSLAFENALVPSLSDRFEAFFDGVDTPAIRMVREFIAA